MKFENMPASIFQPRGSFDPEQFIVADVTNQSMRVFHTPSWSEAHAVRDEWRLGNFVVPGDERKFS